jgi:hypothetical protein
MLRNVFQWRSLHVEVLLVLVQPEIEFFWEFHSFGLYRTNNADSSIRTATYYVVSTESVVSAKVLCRSVVSRRVGKKMNSLKKCGDLRLIA